MNFKVGLLFLSAWTCMRANATKCSDGSAFARFQPEDKSGVFFRNLVDLGIARPETDYRFHQREFFELESHLGFNILARKFPGVQILKVIMEQRYASPQTLESKVEEWMRANGIDFKLLPFSEIESAAVKGPFFSEGHNEVKSRWGTPRKIVDDNSYIRDDFWLWAYAKGFHPAADPHDFLDHLPMMTLPNVAANYRLQGKLGNYLMLLANEPTRTERAASEAQISSDAMQVMARTLLGKIGGPLRNLVYEILPILITDNGVSELVFQGNRSGVIPYGIDRNHPFAPMALQLTGISRDKKAPKLEVDGLFPTTLPRRDTYLKTEEAQTLIGNLRASLGALGVEGSAGLKTVAAKLEAHMIAVGAELGIDEKFGPIEIVRVGDPIFLRFQQGLGNKIAQDPSLRSFFDYKKRIDFWKSSLELYDGYLRWLTRAAY